MSISTCSLLALSRLILLSGSYPTVVVAFIVDFIVFPMSLANAMTSTAIMCSNAAAKRMSNGTEYVAQTETIVQTTNNPTTYVQHSY